MPEEGGNLTVTYILTLPYVEGKDGELVPIVPLTSAQPSDEACCAHSFE